MFDTALVATNLGRDVRRKLATLPAALAVHATALGFVMVGQLWAVQPVAEPEALVVFVYAPPPPPPAAPPARGDGGTTTARPAVTPPVAQPTQPTAVPDRPATAGPPESAGETGGVPGGVPGGQVGGVPGGVPDGPAASVPPPDLDVPVRPGEGIVLPVNLVRHDPAYPELARRAHVQGVVIVEATIDRQGNVVDATVLREPGLGCGAAVVEALRTWKYSPATLNGKPVSIILTLTVTFRINGVS